MCEIFTDKDYDHFGVFTCSGCLNLSFCSIRKRLHSARWNEGFGFPTDKISRNKETYEWECKDFEPIK